MTTQYESTLPLDTSQTISTTAVLLLPNVPIGQIRTEFSIQNISAGVEKASLRYGAQAVANTGIVISPQQGVFQSMDSAIKPWQGEIWAIGSAASTILSIHELRALQ